MAMIQSGHPTRHVPESYPQTRHGQGGGGGGGGGGVVCPCPCPPHLSDLEDDAEHASEQPQQLDGLLVQFTAEFNLWSSGQTV